MQAHPLLVVILEANGFFIMKLSKGYECEVLQAIEKALSSEYTAHLLSNSVPDIK